MTALDWSNSTPLSPVSGLSRGRRLLPARPVRVAALILIIAAVSVADLYLTVLYLKHGGMNESNPVARWVMGLNCQWVLGIWKFLLAGGCCTILWLARRRWSAEVGALIGAAVMIWLGVRWNQYVEIAREADAASSLAAEYHSPNWVQFIDQQ